MMTSATEAMPTAERPLPPEFFELFRHKDGGIYRFVTTALHADDKTELYIYEHLWPFERGVVWARPAVEWASRFTPISANDLTNARRQDILAARAAVLTAKQTRRKAEEASRAAAGPQI